ncbi:MAG: glycosyltransferase [Rhizobacter sp.]|nr:glycosyltransferase [Burkholderiales bacterium]
MSLDAELIPSLLGAFAAAGLPRLLLVTHAWGGGVAQHVTTLAELSSHRARVMILRPCDDHSVEIELVGQQRFRVLSTQWDELLDALKALQFSRVHLHHVEGLPLAILDIDLALAIPLDCTLHDYTSVCPQYQLVDREGRYCGEPDEAACNQCIQLRPHRWQLDIRHWRQAFARVLGRADRVFAPNASVVQKIKRYLPSLDVTCLAHPENTALPPQVVKIALLGTLSNAKGLAVALSVAAYAEASRSPLLLRLIGHAAEPLPPTLTASGSYAVDDLPKLIAAERPDVIWLPSQVPETFCFTLSTALASGLPIVASNIGALADRLRDVPHATLLAFDATVTEWHDALLAASERPPQAPSQISASDQLVPSTTKSNVEAYATHYLNGLPATTTAGSAAALGNLLVTSDSPQALTTLADRPLLNVFRVGVYGGHQPSIRAVDQALAALVPGETHIVGRSQYDAVAEAIDRSQQALISQQAQHAVALEATHQAHAEEGQRWRAALDDADQRAAAAREYIAHLEALVQRQQAHREKTDAEQAEIFSSTSWRITRPLRGVARSARYARHVAVSALRLVPRIPALLHRVVSRFRRGGWKDVLERLIVEFRPLQPASTIKLPGIAPEVIVPLLLHTDPLLPLVSILIPVYGQHGTTFTCIKSISEYPPHRPFEVIVMDDCSPEPAAEALALVSGIRIIRNETNLGFIGNVNLAASHARGQWLVILNNDTVVRQGALDALLDTFDTLQNVGLVGAKLLNTDGSVQEAGGIVWRDGSAWNWGRGQHRDDPRFNFVRDVDFCSGAALAISRELFVDMGGFDSHYSPAYYEDTDLAFRIRARGLRVIYQPAAEIFHIEGISHGRDAYSGVKAHQRSNGKKFYQRWQQTLATHRENASAPELEAHRSSRSNILIVEACMITPDQDAGSVRLLNLLRILRNEGHHVTFLADNLDGNPKYAALLTGIGVEVLHGQYAGSVRKVLRDRGPALDTIIFCRYYVATQYVNSVRALAPRAQIIFDTVDLHFVREQREAQLLGNAAMVRSAALTRANELSVIEKSDVTIVVSDAEKALLAKIAPSARVDVVSQINTLVSPGAPFAERSGILFVGGFRHAPNVDAIQWYVKEVLPLLRKLLPGVVTTIVGSNMPEAVGALQQDGLLFMGYVENIDPLLRAARVSIAPLRYGAGIKGKINEAMNYGIPVVATECAIEGMHLLHERDVLVADLASDFATAIARVYNDAPLWNTLSVAGLANVRQHFSPEAALPAIRALLAQKLA